MKSTTLLPDRIIEMAFGDGASDQLSVLSAAPLSATNLFFYQITTDCMQLFVFLFCLTSLVH